MAVKTRNINKKNFTKCIFCGGSITKKYTGLEDRLYTTKKLFTVVECNSCGAGFINPMPTGDVSMYYPSNYLSGEDTNQSEPKKGLDLEKWYRYNQYNYDFKLLTRATGIKVKNCNSYLDIGCGSGERVTFVSEIGCKVAYGVDKFDFAKNKSKSDAKLINSEVLGYRPTKKFNVVSLFHVLEHVENPKEILSHIETNILAKDGHLILQVPNYGSFERRIFKNKWFGFDAPRHVLQFNESALRKIVIDAGFKVDAVYQLNAPLHPVTLLPSVFRGLDIQRIWVNRKKGDIYKKTMTVLWASLTVMGIPLNILQNLFKRSSMLTIIATKI